MGIIIPGSPATGMTYLELQDETLAYGFDASAYRSRIKSWLNEAQARICRAVTMPDLLTTYDIDTARGTAAYDLPSDLIRVSKFFHKDTLLELAPYSSGNLRPVTQGGNSTEYGTPEAYTIFTALTTQLAPIPDDVYTLTLDYYKAPPALVGDGDVSVLPADYLDLLVSYSLQRCYRSEDDIQMAQFYMGEYQRDLEKLAVDLHGQTSPDGPKVLSGTWGEA